jgi:hypothetical protein
VSRRCESKRRRGQNQGRRGHTAHCGEHKAPIQPLDTRHSAVRCLCISNPSGFNRNIHNAYVCTRTSHPKLIQTSTASLLMARYLHIYMHVQHGGTGVQVGRRERVELLSAAKWLRPAVRRPSCLCRRARPPAVQARQRCRRCRRAGASRHKQASAREA